MKIRYLVVIFSLLALGAAQQQSPPKSTAPGGTAPASIIASHKLHQAPALAGGGPAAVESVHRFINWASASFVSESDDVRKALAGAGENREIAAAFCDEVSHSVRQDHSRTLVTLALLGEMRNPLGTECLVKFLHAPFPEKGTVINGEIIEQTALGTLQGKAVDGLAYLHSLEGDKEVLWAVREHPSRIVRAEAIDAYLWNHQDSAEARATLARYVREDEKVFLDRVRRGEGEGAQQFNPKLENFLKAHPELVAPRPERGPSEPKPPRPTKPTNPPQLDAR